VTPTAAPARRGRGDLLVVGAALTTGVLGVVTLVVAQQHLGLDAFAPLAQLWTIWAVLAAGLTFSFQQWAAVQDVDRTSLLPGGAATRPLVGLALMGVAIFLLTTGLRETIFGSSAMVWPVAAGLLPFGTAFNGVRRGQLARHRQRLGLAAVIAGENAIRLVVTVTLVVLDADPVWFAGALLSGFLVVFGPTVGESAVADEPDRAGMATLGASATAGFLAYAFMFGSPLLLALAGGNAAEVSALFLVLTGVRLPFIVLQAVVPQLAVALATSTDRARSLVRVRRAILLTAVVGTVAGILVGYALGDLVIGTVFSIRGEVAAVAYGLLAGASILSACALIATVALVVERRSRRILVAWGLPTVSAVVVTASGVIAEPTALATWLLAAHATVAVLALIPPRAGQAGSRLDEPTSNSDATHSSRPQRRPGDSR
jgi:hypothetical protein